MASAAGRWIRAATRGPEPGPEPFSCPLTPPPDLRLAHAWRPGRATLSGSAANAAVTDGYHALDRAFAVYLGDPPLSVWVTFAKYSSSQVGRWIRPLEDLMTMAHVLRHGGTVRRGLVAGRGLGADLVETLLRASPLEAARAVLARAGAGGTDPLGRVAVVRDALVEANTEIFWRIGVSFHTFLAAEARGADGREAIAGATRSGRVEDPNGNLARTFVHYREARTLGRRARRAARGDREVLLALRRRLVAEANWIIALQEQALIQRPTIFDHAVMRAACRSAGPGELHLSLAGGESGAPSERFVLLPRGGSWADFGTRMGLVEVDGGQRPLGAVVVPFPEGAGARTYVPDEESCGTILDLFSRYLDGPAGSRLVRGVPTHRARWRS